MALSNPESKNLIVALTERYFCLVFRKYGIPFPADAPWQGMDTVPSLSGNERIFQEVPNMLFEIADLHEKARVEKLIKECATLLLNSGNLYRQFTETISILFDNEITWGKIVTFFSFAVTFAIYLCTTLNEMSHLAARVCVWTGQYVEDKIQPWIDDNGGWEWLLIYGQEALKQKGMTIKLGQFSLMLGVFAVGTFAVKQIFV